MENDRIRDQLEAWAEAIADGEKLDWVSLKKQYPELVDEIEQLMALEKVSGAYQALQETKTPLTAGASANAGADDAPPARWRHLEIREQIGEGSYAKVYRAYDPDLDIDVALKLLRSEQQCPQGSGRFLSEARRLAKVRHPNVIRIHGVDRWEGRIGLWTELVIGRTLEVLVNERAFTAEEAMIVGRELCAALAAVHATGLIHRDITTKNAMRHDNGGQVVLMDFGSMREMRKDCYEKEHPYGTPLSWAPELVVEKKPASVASDIYSVGVLLYRLVTQRFPIEAEHRLELEDKLRRRNYVRLLDRNPHLSRDFIEVVEQALHPDPDVRFRSAGEMDAALAEAQGASAKNGRSDQERKRRRRHQAIAATCLVAVLAIAGTVKLIDARSLSVHVAVAKRSGAGEAPVPPCSVLDAGDQLLMRLKSSRDVFVYVLTQTGDSSRVTSLFPTGGDLDNPLGRRTEFVLPGAFDGTPRYWTVNSSAERERMLVVAATQPISELEPPNGLRDIVPPVAPNTNLSVLAASLRRQWPPRDLWLEMIEFACATAK